MSLISQIIVNADNELRYPSIGELQSINSYLKTGEKRINISCILRDKEKEIIQQASKTIFQIHPEYIAPGGNAEGARKRSLCLRDYSWYLRLITYGILAGDKNSIEKIGIIGVREMYNSLGVPIIGMIDAIDCLKKATAEFLNEEEIIIVAPYFDFIIQGMS
uniref:Allophycocyanin gamma subunit n=2 Tax=Gracilariopsis TaxID=2781 RepID=A0A1C9CF27_9FLOR|nr:allphycocyanin gamma chain [Gracilariopsis lemaneiformis]YP_009294709.1 allophycocyanin gamma subunit [Gracilariopsis chorda]AJO68355.1 allophycocyanin gamma subunit [Gracilariopsis lemaneiformis]AML79775.1 allphycocyanin gamma chain [Gracilariopsis lemaneiformis]AOM66969.1 allophycocyanin gamma subunit [Gracilariopsis chorda]UAD88769.1 allophycocyanin gamma subunit [Gracilariopsis chorda]